MFRRYGQITHRFQTLCRQHRAYPIPSLEFACERGSWSIRVVQANKLVVRCEAPVKNLAVQQALHAALLKLCYGGDLEPYLPMVCPDHIGMPGKHRYQRGRIGTCAPTCSCLAQAVDPHSFSPWRKFLAPSKREAKSTQIPSGAKAPTHPFYFTRVLIIGVG